MAKKKPLLKLDRREATLGTSINTWGLIMGQSEERKPAKSIKVRSSISLGELCSLSRDKLAGEAFFVKNDQGLLVPRWKGKLSSPFPLEGDFLADVVIVTGINLTEIVLGSAKLTKLRFEPLDGGRSEFESMIQWEPEEEGDDSQLEHWLAQDVKFEATLRAIDDEVDERQAQLPMNDPSDAPKTLEQAIAADQKCRHGVPMGEDCAACDVDAGQVGTPAQERDKAAQRERDIALQIEQDRAAGGVVGNTLASPSKRAKRGKGDRATAH